MLRASIDQACAGMVLAMPIHHPRSASRLLAEGYRLDRRAIDRLRQLGVVEVWVEYPSSDLLRSYLSPRILEQRGRALASVTQMFHNLHRNVFTTLNYADYRRGVRDLIASLTTEPAAANYIAELTGRPENDFRHAAAVSMISLLLGLKLQNYLIHERSRLSPRYARNVVKLALGAMLHDVGTLRIAPEHLRRALTDGDETDPQWRRHPMLGYQMLCGRVDPTAITVVLHHHQYFDGSGYPDADTDLTGLHTCPPPRSLSGHDIHIFARICAVADHYDRLRHPVGRRERSRVQTLHMMLNPPLSARFDPVVLRALFEVVPAYAPGSIVRLNTGDRAIVVGWAPDHPCRPTVQVVDEDALTPEALVRAANASSFVEPVYYDLRRCTDLCVVEEDGREVAPYNFDLPPKYDAGLEEAA